jgi:fructokinase
MNLRPALWARDTDPKPRLWAGLEVADIIKLSAEEFAFLHDGHDDAATVARIFEGTATLLVVTDGAAPMRWFLRDGNGTLHGYSVTAVDATAAGDAFVGGLLARLADEKISPSGLATLVADRDQLFALLRYAAACGAITATRKGSFTAIPDADEVRRFMEHNA